MLLNIAEYVHDPEPSHVPSSTYSSRSDKRSGSFFAFSELIPADPIFVFSLRVRMGPRGFIVS